MPTPLEFGSFLLLPTYFAQILYPKEMKLYWGYIQPLYIIIIFGLIFCQALWAVLGAFQTSNQEDCLAKENFIPDHKSSKTHIDDGCFHTEISSGPLRFITVVCFAFLAFVQGFLGNQLLFVDRHHYDRYLVTPPHVLNRVNIVLILSYLTRSIYQILASFKIYIIPTVPLQRNMDLAFETFLMFELWDYLPVS